jgi:hypothetical protein
MGRFGGMAHDLTTRNVQKGANHVRIRRTSSMTLKIPASVVPCIVVHFRAKQGQLQICLAVLSLGLRHTQQHHHRWKWPPLDGTWLRSAAIR